MSEVLSDVVSTVVEHAAALLREDSREESARALHHQHGGAGVHGEHAAGRGRDPVGHDVAGGDRGLRRGRRQPAGQSRHAGPRAARGHRHRAGRGCGQAPALGARSGVRRSLAVAAGVRTHADCAKARRDPAECGRADGAGGRGGVAGLRAKICRTNRNDRCADRRSRRRHRRQAARESAQRR